MTMEEKDWLDQNVRQLAKMEEAIGEKSIELVKLQEARNYLEALIEALGDLGLKGEDQ